METNMRMTDKPHQSKTMRSGTCRQQGERRRQPQQLSLGAVATANYPAIIVTPGLGANGMPVGVVPIGKPGEEAKLRSYAYALEQATKLRVDPNLTQAQ
jgi:Asp-tRNA(Asn)/Glu-tRNA(Gln) amidotransferase A subunit family amidase